MPEVLFELLGEDFAVDAAIVGSPLKEYARIQRRGDATESKDGKVHETSALQVRLGGADGEFAGLEQQITEATSFLEDEAAEIRRIRGLPGVQVARLRFGALWSEDTGAKFSSFPSSLLLRCG